jgi:hypothetical protein
MTNPTPDHTWNPQDLPVLTDVVDVEAIPVLDIPAYDFSAELDALARVLPDETQPELTLPDELSLDDVLGEEASDSERASLNASQLIERLPSLDLEVDLPAELSLDDVLPGLDYGRGDPSLSGTVAPEHVPDDFAFELEDKPDTPAAANPGGDHGLGALFARATFEPVTQASPEPATDLAVAEANPLQADQVSLDQFAAQLDDFDEPADLPELPLDAFLSKADDTAAPQAEVFVAESTEDEWAGTWEPPTAPAPELAPLNGITELDEAHQTPEQASHDVPVLDVPVLMDTQWDASLPEAAVTPDAAEHASLDVAPAHADPLTAFEALPWDVPDEPVAAPAPNLAMSIDEILAGLQPVVAPPVSPQTAEPAAETREAETVADAWQPPPLATVEPAWRDEPVAPVAAVDEPVPEPVTFVAVEAAPDVVVQEAREAEPIATVAVAQTPLDAVLATPESAPLVSAALPTPPEQDAPQGRAVEPVPAWLQAAQPELAAVAQDEPAVSASPVAADTDGVQSISLDSLPMGVLGGGLGLATAAVSPAAILGEPAAKLPGGDWPLANTGFHAGDKEVELAWARDLGAEPPLDLDQLPLATEPAPAQPVIAEIIRVRRQPAQAEASATEAAPPAQPQPVPVPVLSEDDIHIEAVSQAMPAQASPVAAAPGVMAGLDEDALIEALYARVLPRMKVELTLWMQDALEQQAKQLMAGVMKQLKEDFDMMLAESLRASLREALDEAASHHKEV